MTRLGLILLSLSLLAPAFAAVTPRPNRAPVVQSPLRSAVTPRVNRKPAAPARPLVLPSSKIPAQAIVPSRSTFTRPTPEPTLSDAARWHFYSYP